MTASQWTIYKLYAGTDWGFDWSTFRLAGHVITGQIQSLLSVLLCITELWSEILGEMQLEPLFTICALKQTLGFTHF